MVDEQLEDGRRIAELLSSELSGRSDGVLDRVTVENADLDVTGTPAGERAYDIAADGTVLGAVFVHDERARVTVRRGATVGRSVADDADLPTRSTPAGHVHVFVESGAAVKRVLPVIEAVVTDGGE